jgi:hypothetical protein
MTKTQDGRSKLKNLILYVASKMEPAESFGVTKLNKVLFRAEYAAYRELGHKLTEFKYQKNAMGPTLRAFLPVTAEMRDDGLIDWDIRAAGPAGERRVRALARPDMGGFSPAEVRIIDREIDRAWHLTAAQVSDEEHETAAWFATKLGETIKPELSFVEDPGTIIPLREDEEERAQAAIERYLARARAAAGARARA